MASAEEALAGARDIIAEWVNEDTKARASMRELFWSKGLIRSKVLPDKMEEGIKYKDYYDWEEKVSTAPSHRVLAIRRGEREEFLSLSITPPEEEAIRVLTDMFVKGRWRGRSSGIPGRHRQLQTAVSLSMETETRLAAKKKADETAIRVFADNLRQLLMAPPLGQKAVLAIDPGFRTGCKTVCLDRSGQAPSSRNHFSAPVRRQARSGGAGGSNLVRPISDRSDRHRQRNGRARDGKFHQKSGAACRHRCGYGQ